ncbi:MAG: glycosyltransferase family 9 protein, partial [Verrucomicrobiota bacterium]
MSAPSATAPRAALILKVDTLGDLVVFAPVLHCLPAAWPDTRLAVVIRRGYVDLARLLVAGIEWVPTRLDPFGQGPETDPVETNRLRDFVATLAPAVVVAATSRRNWLEAALGAEAPAARRLALGADADDEFFATRLRVALGLNAANVFPERLPVPANEPDWQGNFRLADALLGRTVARTAPALRLDDPTLATVAGFLAQEKLTPGGYVVCAAAGFANVRLKTWPAERFGATLRQLREKRGLQVLLVGHQSEAAHLETVRAAAGGASLWLGGDGELAQLAALLAQAKLYLGNDTGAMHLAAALGVPVVALFGGGTW